MEATPWLLEKDLRMVLWLRRLILMHMNYNFVQFFQYRRQCEASRSLSEPAVSPSAARSVLDTPDQKQDV